MNNNSLKSNSMIVIFAGCAVLIALFLIVKEPFYFEKNTQSNAPSLFLTPWQSIGGCGAGGSGGGSTDGIKWVGQGVSGGLVDVEVLPKLNIGQNFSIFTFAPRFSFKPTWTTTLGIRPSISSKSGEVQPRSQMDPYDRTTGGLGDCYIDWQRAFGMNGEYGFMLGLNLPFGQYDIKRGSDKAPQFLPASLQKGGGTYSLTGGLSYLLDVDDGMWMADFMYSFPFVARPFSKKNSFIDEGEYFENYAGFKNDARFYYRGKPYGENDLGAFTPMSLSGSLCFAYRGIEHYVHSFGFAYAIPLGVAWIHSEKTNSYDPRPDPDHKAWSTAFVYGLEFSKSEYPVFMAISLPIHDRKNTPNPNNEYDPSPMRKWDAPDWKDFLNQWTFALGFKSTMF